MTGIHQPWRLARLLADSMLSPAQNLLQAERILMVHQALDSMDADGRQILTWVHYESLSRSSLGERLGINEEARVNATAGL